MELQVYGATGALKGRLGRFNFRQGHVFMVWTGQYWSSIFFIFIGFLVPYNGGKATNRIFWCHITGGKPSWCHIMGGKPSWCQITRPLKKSEIYFMNLWTWKALSANIPERFYETILAVWLNMLVQLRLITGSVIISPLDCDWLASLDSDWSKINMWAWLLSL